MIEPVKPSQLLNPYAEIQKKQDQSPSPSVQVVQRPVKIPSTSFPNFNEYGGTLDIKA